MKAKRKRIALRNVLKRELKDPEFSFYYRREKAVSEIARLVRDARLRAGLTQAQLAEKRGPARLLLLGWNRGPMIEFLRLICSSESPAH